ncbi:hypothetical protein DV738_g2226, partial [Chaetothyriales sp. CBS 135597]
MATMNQPQPYMDMHSGPHISSGPAYSHAAHVTAPPMQHYTYQAQPVLPPNSTHYAPPSYSSYAYGANGVTSPQSAPGPGVQSSMPLPAMIANPSQQHAYAPPNSAPQQGYTQAQQPFDTTGQIAPPGMKPRVTATLWEDEGSLCFQVEAKGVCVARREDNHFINGTKLLNVAGMTRGRRDGILKSEKTRHVVKIGPMHLKGVWIPYDRALEFANKEKITDLLYPLFVHNIGGLLYNPENAPRTNAVVAATERRRMDSGDSSRGPQATQPPPALHHHHSMQPGVGAQAPPTPHSIAPHPNAGRPNIERAHTFPTPPTSASSVLGMGNQGSSYDWGNQNLSNGVNGAQPLSLDTGMNARSMPTTPATTPPSNAQQSIPGYQAQTAYDKNVYNTTPGSQTAYSQHSDPARYGQEQSYPKTEMGPPTAPPAAYSAHDAAHVSSQSQHEHENGEHHENGYIHGSASAYDANRGQYATYPSGPTHLSPEMTGSPHQSASGRGTPRTLPSSQPQWGSEYQTPPRSGTSSSVYNVIGANASASVPSSGGTYPSSAYSAAGVKRGRDDEDRPSTRDYDYGAKRQKSTHQDSFGIPLQAPHMQAIKSGGQR